MFEGALCKQFALKVFCVFKFLMLVSGVLRWTLHSFKNMYEASNPWFCWGWFFTLFEDFYESLATRVGFFDLALSGIESCSVQTLEILSAVDSSTGKKKDFDN